MNTQDLNNPTPQPQQTVSREQVGWWNPWEASFKALPSEPSQFSAHPQRWKAVYRDFDPAPQPQQTVSREAEAVKLLRGVYTGAYLPPEWIKWIKEFLATIDADENPAPQPQQTVSREQANRDGILEDIIKLSQLCLDYPKIVLTEGICERIRQLPAPQPVSTGEDDADRPVYIPNDLYSAVNQLRNWIPMADDQESDPFAVLGSAVSRVRAAETLILKSIATMQASGGWEKQSREWQAKFENEYRKHQRTEEERRKLEALAELRRMTSRPDLPEAISQALHCLPDRNGHQIGMMEVGYGLDGQINYGPFWMSEPETREILQDIITRKEALK